MTAVLSTQATLGTLAAARPSPPRLDLIASVVVVAVLAVVVAVAAAARAVAARAAAVVARVAVAGATRGARRVRPWPPPLARALPMQRHVQPPRRRRRSGGKRPSTRACHRRPPAALMLAKAAARLVARAVADAVATTSGVGVVVAGAPVLLVEAAMAAVGQPFLQREQSVVVEGGSKHVVRQGDLEGAAVASRDATGIGSKTWPDGDCCFRCGTLGCARARCAWRAFEARCALCFRQKGGDARCMLPVLSLYDMTHRWTSAMHPP